MSQRVVVLGQPAVGATLIRKKNDAPTRRRRASKKNERARRQTRFESMSNQIVARIDEMGQRIDDLEKSIGELTDAAGIDPDVGEEKA